MRKLVMVAAAVGAALVVSPPAAAAPSWTMPNLLGMDLQGAQDAVQSLTHDTVWFSSSTDLTESISDVVGGIDAGSAARGPLFGPVEVIEAENREFAGNHPRQGVQGVGNPFLVGHDGDSLERRMAFEQGAQPELEVLDQPAGSEAFVVGFDDLHDSDLPGLKQALHDRFDLTQVVATQSSRYPDAGAP